MNIENSAGKQIACKQGFPAKPTKAKWKEPAGYFLHGGIEILTSDLIRGKEIGPETVSDALSLINRVEALKAALEARANIHYPPKLEEVA